jgi:hypothetical protein
MRIRSLVALVPKSNLPKSVRSPISNQSHGTLRITRSARNQEVVVFLLWKPWTIESRLIGLAWGETTPASEMPPPTYSQTHGLNGQ